VEGGAEHRARRTASILDASAALGTAPVGTVAFRDHSVVTGNLPAGTASFTDNGMTIAACLAVALPGSSNSRNATCDHTITAKDGHVIGGCYAGEDTERHSVPWLPAVNRIRVCVHKPAAASEESVMSMSVTTASPAPLSDLPNAEASKPADKASGAVSKSAQAKAQLNASIVQASIEVSINSQNEPLALLLKSAIAGINDLLEPELGKNAIQNAMSQDNTPEATAGRIVSLSTGMFELFKQQHPGEDASAVFKNFMTTIRSGFEQGFKEASGILSGMNVLNGDVASGISKTYELVQKGYADFEASFVGSGADAAKTVAG